MKVKADWEPDNSTEQYLGAPFHLYDIKSGHSEEAARIGFESYGQDPLAAAEQYKPFAMARHERFSNKAGLTRHGVPRAGLNENLVYLPGWDHPNNMANVSPGTRRPSLFEEWLNEVVHRPEEKAKDLAAGVSPRFPFKTVKRNRVSFKEGVAAYLHMESKQGSEQVGPQAGGGTEGEILGKSLGRVGLRYLVTEDGTERGPIDEFRAEWLTLWAVTHYDPLK